MLRIILEFNDVIAIIVAAHQMGLCAAPHPPDMLDRQSHGAMLASQSQLSKRIVPLRESCRTLQSKMYRSGTTSYAVSLKKPGQRDWAALCMQKNSSIIFVYWNEPAKSPTQLAPLDETLTLSKRGYFRILHVAGEKFMRSHQDAYAPEMDPLPRILDHDGIDDGILEKGSSVHYFDNGKWLTLAGPD
jgi:hypothetical protein